MAKFSDSDYKALVGLVRVMIGLDQHFSEEEADFLESIADEIGTDVFWQYMDDSYEEEVSADDIWDLAEAVTNEDVRETIYGHLYELSISDGIDASESDMLDRLAEMWELDISDAS